MPDGSKSSDHVRQDKPKRRAAIKKEPWIVKKEPKAVKKEPQIVKKLPQIVKKEPGVVKKSLQTVKKQEALDPSKHELPSKSDFKDSKDEKSQFTVTFPTESSSVIKEKPESSDTIESE